MKYETHTNEDGESVTHEVAADGYVLEPDPNDPEDVRNIPYYWEDQPSQVSTSNERHDMLFESDLYTPDAGDTPALEVATKFALILRILSMGITSAGYAHAFGQVGVADPVLAMAALDKVEEAHQIDPSRGLIQR